MKALRACGIYIAFAITFLPIYAHAGWTPPVRISDEATSFGPRIVANGDILHVAYWRWGEYIATYYLRSENGGGEWEEPFLLADTSSTSNSVSPVIRISEEFVMATWRYTAGPSRWNIGFRKSTDGGENWDETLAILPTDNYELQKQTFYILDNTIFLIYSRRAQDLIFELTKSANWGDSWTESAEVFRTQETGRFDMAGIGDTIHFVWVGRFDYDGEWEIYYIRSTDAGDSWSENTVLSTVDDRGSNWPTISMNSQGNIAVCWMDYKYSPYLITGDIFIRYSYDGGERWTEEEQLSSHHFVFPVRVLWRGDSIHVVWEDWRNEQPDVYYKYSKDNGLTWEDEQRVEDDPGSSEDPDLGIVGEKIHLVWADFGQTSGSGIYYSRWDEEVGVDDHGYRLMPDAISLSAYPNPFNSFTTITYNGFKGGEIEIYNIAGQKIKFLKPENMKEGQIKWDARNALGNKVSTGIYFARAGAPQNSITIKLLYLK